MGLVFINILWPWVCLALGPPRASGKRKPGLLHIKLATRGAAHGVQAKGIAKGKAT